MPAERLIGEHQLVRMLDGWAELPGRMHDRLADALRQLVYQGGLYPGARLPAERVLARGLGVGRNTVSSAFDELRADGVVASRHGSGTYVAHASSTTIPRSDGRLDEYANERSHRANWIDLRSAALPGLPLVLEEFTKMSGSELAELVPTHGYVPRGLWVLREAIARYYTVQGLPTSAAQVLVTSGAQQALQIVASALVEPGAHVFVEEPSFRGAIDVLQRVGARAVPVIQRPGAIDATALRAAIRTYRPALILVQSTVHNPTGCVLDEASRRTLAAIARQEQVPILDDGAPADALIDPDPPTPLASFGGAVITVGSASKSFWGGLRVGWVRADEPSVDHLATVKGSEDLGTSLLAQLLATRLLSRIDEARERRRTDLRHARAVVLDAVHRLLPDWRPTIPEGGASLWVRLPQPCATAFTQRCERAGVALLPGPTFSCVEELDDHVRVAYARPIDYVLRGIERAAHVWRQRPATQGRHTADTGGRTPAKALPARTSRQLPAQPEHSGRAPDKADL